MAPSVDLSPELPADAGVSPSPPALEARRSRRPPLALLLCALVLLPIIVSVARHAIGGWVPEGDDAWMARRTMQTFTANPPLIGQESTASDVPEESGLSHPGPLPYYVMSVPYALTGWAGWGFMLGAAIVTGLSAVSIIVLARRAAGPRAALAMAFALALVAVHLGMHWLVRPGSSVHVVMPVIAGLVALWAFQRGERSAGLLAVVFASYAAQTSLVVLPVAGLLLLATGGVAAARWVRDGRWWSRTTSWCLALVLVTWIPPVIDEFTRPSGNLSNLIHYLFSDASGAERQGRTASLGLERAGGTVIDLVANPLGLADRGLPVHGIWFIRVGSVPLVPLGIFLVLLTATVYRAWRTRDRDVASLLAIGTVFGLAAIFAMSRRPTDAMLAPVYFVLWVKAITVMFWGAMALTALRLLPDRPPTPDTDAAPAPADQAIPRGTPALLVGIAGLMVLASCSSTLDTSSERVRSLSAQVRSAVPADTVAIRPRNIGTTFTAKGVGADLISRGYDARFLEWGGMPDERSRMLAPSQASLVFVDGQDVAEADLPSQVATWTGPSPMAIFWVTGGPYADYCRFVLASQIEVLGGASPFTLELYQAIQSWPEDERTIVEAIIHGPDSLRGALARRTLGQEQVDLGGAIGRAETLYHRRCPTRPNG